MPKTKEDVMNLIGKERYDERWPSNYFVPPEWADILYEALDKVFELHPDAFVTQIKEKFKEPRIYVHNIDKDADEILYAAERDIYLLTRGEVDPDE